MIASMTSRRNPARKHDETLASKKDMDGRDKPGHDGGEHERTGVHLWIASLRSQ
jgi:hypothetical protein